MKGGTVMKKFYVEPAAVLIQPPAEDILTSSLNDLGAVERECDYSYWGSPDVYQS